MKCQWSEGCSEQARGKGKLCKEHSKMAWEMKKAKMDADREARESRYAAFERIWNLAKATGIAAGEAHEPEPMIVQQRLDVLNDTSPVVKEWHSASGVCGFGWITVFNGNCSFARWLVKNGHASKSYSGGVRHYVHEHGQSYERKMAHVRAMVGVLGQVLDVDDGIKGIYGGGRLD